MLTAGSDPCGQRRDEPSGFLQLLRVLNAFSDTFTPARYTPDGNPLVVGGGRLVGAAVFLGIVGVGASVRSQRIKREHASTVTDRSNALTSKPAV
jgi:hypothetical protein